MEEREGGDDNKELAIAMKGNGRMGVGQRWVGRGGSRCRLSTDNKKRREGEEEEEEEESIRQASTNNSVPSIHAGRLVRGPPQTLCNIVINNNNNP